MLFGKNAILRSEDYERVMTEKMMRLYRLAIINVKIVRFLADTGADTLTSR